MKFDYEAYEAKVNELVEKDLDEAYEYQSREMNKFLEEYRKEADSKAKKDICEIIESVIAWSENGSVNLWFETKGEAQAVYDEILSEYSPVAPMLSEDCDLYKDGEEWVVSLMFYGDYVPGWDGFEE